MQISPAVTIYVPTFSPTGFSRGYDVSFWSNDGLESNRSADAPPATGWPRYNRWNGGGRVISGSNAIGLQMRSGSSGLAWATAVPPFERNTVLFSFLMRILQMNVPIV